MKIFCKIFKIHTIKLKNFFEKTEKIKFHIPSSAREENMKLCYIPKKKSAYSLNNQLLGKSNLSLQPFQKS